MNQPAEPLRTAPPVYQGGRIYECDPAAVARLKRLMAEQRRQKEGAEAERLARQIDHAARLRAEAKRRKAQQARAAEPPPEPKPAPKPKIAQKPGRQRRRFTADELAAAVAAHNSGQTWRKVAAGMGVSRATLRAALIAAGYDIGDQPKVYRGRSRRVTDDMTRAAHARQLAGEQLKDIAAEWSMSPSLLNRHFRRLGLTSVKNIRKNDKNAPPAPRRRNNDAHAAVAIEVHAGGKPWREIAAELGVARTTLHGWVKGYKARQEPFASNGNSSTGNLSDDNPNDDSHELDR